MSKLLGFIYYSYYTFLVFDFETFLYGFNLFFVDPFELLFCDFS